jgi:hypothetical protein
LLSADISQFYPSLYTHAVGWAIDPKARERKNWNSKKLLGTKIDQALMDTDLKISQGIPIGNDVSFLLAEVVLSQVDKAMGLRPESSYRWYDDYEMSFETREEAEQALQTLRAELGRFRLRLNPSKTTIDPLPRPSEDEWREMLFSRAKIGFRYPNDMVRYFDAAFRFRESHPEAPVLSYSIGRLYGLACPEEGIGRIAQSCITQALLCEPGVAQKAFSLLSYWKLNGFIPDLELLKNTITQMILRHRTKGFGSDVAWALAFCLQENLSLNRKAGEALCNFQDDFIVLQALDMHDAGHLSYGFKKTPISRTLKQADLDREHWLLAYESVRHGFLSDCAIKVQNNSLFSGLLSNKISFYRRKLLPPYALIAHPEGAPRWVVRRWLGQAGLDLGGKILPPDSESPPAAKLIDDAFARLKASSHATVADTLAKLMRTIADEDALSEISDDDDTY